MLSVIVVSRAGLCLPPDHAGRVVARCFVTANASFLQQPVSVCLLPCCSSTAPPLLLAWPRAPRALLRGWLPLPSCSSQRLLFRRLRTTYFFITVSDVSSRPKELSSSMENCWAIMLSGSGQWGPSSTSRHSRRRPAIRLEILLDVCHDDTMQLKIRKVESSVFLK